MGYLRLNEENFDSTIKEGLTLVDFYAEWCGPCKLLSPIIDEIAMEKTDVKIAKLNVDEAKLISKRYKVMSIPTLIIFKDGEMLDKKMGFMNLEQIRDFIEEYE